nr:immunoglobulin heavy chain junction region [Mus musculus]
CARWYGNPFAYW